MQNNSPTPETSKEDSPLENDIRAANSSPLQELPPEKREGERLPSREEIEILSQSLVNYASRHQLSVRNVRNIIKQLLTDERLIIFAQQLAGDIPDTSVRLPGAKSTPGAGAKRTRSKRKENKEAASSQEREGTALLSMSFSELDSSSDEEYNPQLDRSDSRDHEEHHDEITSPSSLSSAALTPEPAFSDVDSLLSLPQCTHTDSYAYTNIEPVAVSPGHMTDFQMQSNSYSTRSRACLKGKNILELEAGLDAPDAIIESPEEISNGGESEAWRNWLASFCLADSSERSGSDSEDADYNFLQDIDKEIESTERREEFRYDFRVRVSQREIFELVNSLVEEAGPWGNFPDTSEVVIPENESDNQVALARENNNKLTWEVLDSGVDLTQEQKAAYSQCMNQLQTQLQQHLQILFQIYVLSLNDPHLEEENAHASRLILDFYNNTTTNQNNIFNFPGLEEAMQIVYSPPEVEWKPKKNKLIPSTTINIMREYSLFWIFPKLLPHQQLMPFKRTKDDEQKGRKFVLAEDCMLAFGLSVFGLVDGLMKICQYILPTKTPKQIISRIRNLCSSRYETNVVKHWKQTQELRIPWKELEGAHPDTLPLWAQQYIDELNTKSNAQPKGNFKKVKTKARTQPIELSPSFINRMLLECDSIGKNLSQRHRLAIMNIIFDIDKYQSTSALDRNTFYRRLASGLWCFVTTALRSEEETYHQLISTIEHNADGNLHQLVEKLSIVLKHHPALLFLFLKFLKTPSQQKEDQKRAFLKAKTFIDRVRDKFKSNPEMAHRVFATVNTLSKDRQPNQELEELIRLSLTRFEGSDEIFNQYISEKNEMSSVSDDDFEEVYLVENENKTKSTPQDFNKYEFEEIYFESQSLINADHHMKESGSKKKITKSNETKECNKKNIVAKKGKMEMKSNKRRNNLKTDRNKKQKLNTSDN